jgi:peptide/nickel transport system substrate-binding protein
VDGSFAVATVAGTAHSGPLWGENNGTVTNSASVTTEQMMDIATFLEAGWEICEVAAGEVNTDCQWNIIKPGGYPFLSDIAANLAPTIPSKNPGSFVQMTIGDPETLDPAAAYDTASGEQISYVYEPLIMYKGTESAELVGVLATEWTWNSVDLTWHFKIRKNVKFHKGGTLTPEDVEYSFERAMIYDRLGGPIWMFFEPLLLAGEYAEVTFADVDAAVEVDGDWVVFTLADPGYKLIWLQTIANGWGSILDKEWCVANGEWDGTEADAPNHYQVEDGATYLWTHMNGTGPWKLNLWDRGVQIKLEKFAGYWGHPAPFDWVITRKVEEWTTRKQALLAGDADFVYVPPANIHELDGMPGLTVYQDLPEPSVDAFFFNFNIGAESQFIGSGALDGNGIPTDFFSDPDVRKGFCYAFDYETYVNDALLGQAQQVGSPIIEGLYGYNPDARKYTLDLGKATEHFRKAFGGQVWDKGFKLTLLYNTSNIPLKTACEILGENLYSINPKFDVNVQSIDWASYLSGMAYGCLPMFQAGWTVDYPHADDIVVPFMASDGTFACFQGYGYPQLDELIEGALKELDPAVQEDLYYEIQERYYEDAPSIMLGQPLGTRYFSEYIEGFYFNPMIPGQAGPLYYMSKSSS